MKVSRFQRKAEEQQMIHSNAKKLANTNLKKNVTVLGAGLFFGGVTAQASTALTTQPVFADTTDSDDQTATTNDTTDSGVGMITPRGVGDQAFVTYLGNTARKLAENNDLYASVMIAQALIESGWGTSGLASSPNYNLFGIKGSYKGTAVNMATQEDDGTGSLYSINSDFKKYPSYKESLEDYVSLLRGGVSGNPQIYAGTWKSNTSSYKDATAFLTGRYATDTTYADKLNNIIEKYNLTRFDEPLDEDSNSQTYIYAQGDTLQSVADKFNISLQTLMDLNGLKTSSYVYPGKTLIVNKVIGDDDDNNSETSAVQAVDLSTNATTNDSSTVDDNDDMYQGKQAPVIVQDETNGVKKYDKSDSSANVAVSVNNSTGSTTATSPNFSSETNYPATASNSSSSSDATNNSAVTEVSTPSYSTGSTTSTTTTTTTPDYSSSNDSTATNNNDSSASAANSNASTSSQTESSTTPVAAQTTNDSQTQTTKTEATAKSDSVTVKDGDSIQSLAAQAGITVEQLKQINNLKSDLLVVGQLIKL